jgi:hypothetical protein
VTAFVYPQLCFTPAKQELWDSDPVEFVRTTVGKHIISFLIEQHLTMVTDEYDNFASPVSAATTFLFSLSSNRTKTTFMSIIGFIHNVLQSYVVAYVYSSSLI